MTRCGIQQVQSLFLLRLTFFLSSILVFELHVDHLRSQFSHPLNFCLTSTVGRIPIQPSLAKPIADARETTADHRHPIKMQRDQSRSASCAPMITSASATKTAVLRDRILPTNKISCCTLFYNSQNIKSLEHAFLIPC